MSRLSICNYEASRVFLVVIQSSILCSEDFEKQRLS